MCSCNMCDETGCCGPNGCLKKFCPCCVCVNPKKFAGGIPQYKANTNCCCLVLY